MLPIQPQPQSQQVTEKPAVPNNNSSGFRSKLSIVPSKDNFVTFTPLKDSSKKSAGVKKPKFKEPIFVTELPQNAYKKKKPTASPSNHSSGEENSDDDMLLDDMVNASPNSKKLSSKERRQVRNRISARNFRVRRKEYITQLEEKVEEHEKTIENLKQENSKLRTANEELLQQVLSQPVTPPASDDLFSSSSGSEGHQSPESGPVPAMFQFQMDDLYDFSLFDQQQQSQNMIDTSNLFYLNHAVMPDWDIHQVLGGKGRPNSSEEMQRQISRDLITDYPLLAPALMSIVIRHTLTLEYVASLAKEFSDATGASLTTETTKKKKMLELEQGTEVSKEQGTKVSKEQARVELKEHVKADSNERLTDEEFLESILVNYFPSYLLARARGKSHDEIIASFRKCTDNNAKCQMKRVNKDEKKAKQVKTKEAKPQSKFAMLNTYCRVAGTLLKHPQQMSQVRNVLKQEISFSHNKHTALIENNYASMISPFKKLRITTQK
ncbi:uncharacterized protein EV154DRAFT_420846 [Mucor mucedo]|uniref:uncharacterized protein n=1 Tax=Mucor mucedo TaxID=29922 RepID=UPI00221E8834|nr:uncharacterized protein EV154DRAFT_420846 [Mucor mucedo]KAI7891220.1 hypothetical protein EV154DRAFT_420846 [Mucor mucedo]